MSKPFWELGLNPIIMEKYISLELQTTRHDKTQIREKKKRWNKIIKNIKKN